jgi:hypothetical protein
MADGPNMILLDSGGGTNWLEPGFTSDGITNYLFKKAQYRVNTSLEQTYYQEPAFKPSIFRDYVATDKIPAAPPTDFVLLTAQQIKDQFGVSDAEIASFETKIAGSNVFSIEQSVAYPHIYKINYMLMASHPSNPGGTFRTFTTRSRVNMLSSTIPFSYGNGGYRGRFYRTDRSANLSADGRDMILSQQLAYIYDFDSGFFMAHESDEKPYTTNPIGVLNPPAITCYIYRGAFGKFGWSFVKDDAIALDETRLLVGKKAVDDPTLVMDVSGSAFVTDLYSHSFNTTSDMRLKKNIHPVFVPKELLSIEPRTYHYTTSPADAPVEFGVLAQEVEAVMPHLVRTNPDGFKSVMYDRVGVALLPIVREQEARITILEKENGEMREMLQTIAAKLKL